MEVKQVSENFYMSIKVSWVFSNGWLLKSLRQETDFKNYKISIYFPLVFI